MKAKPTSWRKLMDEIACHARDVKSSGLPDPLVWRQDVAKLMSLTGLRLEQFGQGEGCYAQTIALKLSPPKIPESVPPLPDHFVAPALAENVTTELFRTRCVALTGMGGAGKSVIASVIARNKSIRRRFCDGVLWLMDGKSSDNRSCRLLEQLRALAAQFRDLVLIRHYRQGLEKQFDEFNFTDLEHAQEYFPMWRKKFDLQCLLVVDNVWNSVRYSLPFPRVAMPDAAFVYLYWKTLGPADCRPLKDTVDIYDSEYSTESSTENGP